MRHDPLDALARQLRSTADEIAEAWAAAAAAAGDAATHLIAEIALGRGPGGSPEEIEAEWSTVTDSSSGEEIAAMTVTEARAQVASWGSPWPDEPLPWQDEPWPDEPWQDSAIAGTADEDEDEEEARLNGGTHPDACSYCGSISCSAAYGRDGLCDED